MNPKKYRSHQKLPEQEAKWKWEYLQRKINLGENITRYIEQAVVEEKTLELLGLQYAEYFYIEDWISNHLNHKLYIKLDQAIRRKRKRFFDNEKLIFSKKTIELDYEAWEMLANFAKRQELNLSQALIKVFDSLGAERIEELHLQRENYLKTISPQGDFTHIFSEEEESTVQPTSSNPNPSQSNSSQANNNKTASSKDSSSPSSIVGNQTILVNPKELFEDAFSRGKTPTPSSAKPRVIQLPADPIFNLKPGEELEVIPDEDFVEYEEVPFINLDEQDANTEAEVNLEAESNADSPVTTILDSSQENTLANSVADHKSTSQQEVNNLVVNSSASDNLTSNALSIDKLDADDLTNDDLANNDGDDDLDLLLPIISD